MNLFMEAVRELKLAMKLASTMVLCMKVFSKARMRSIITPVNSALYWRPVMLSTKTSVALKANPMANWKREAVWDYLKANGIPYNPLHDRGYRSIGCWPCTRATDAGENERAGRWTGFDKAECGIHTFLGESI